MNKNDMFFLLILLVVSFSAFSLLKRNHINGSKAIVYYQNEKLQTIDLGKDQEYQVQGKLGKVTLQVKKHQIWVHSENSPNHICQKQGAISQVGQSLICLPNEIVIQIVGNSDIDTVTR